MKDFATSFNQADVLIITDIYAAGENPIEGITGEALYKEIQQFGHKCVYFEPDIKKIPALVAKLTLPQDMIFVLGAGSIYQSIPKIIKKLKDILLKRISQLIQHQLLQQLSKRLISLFISFL